MGKLQTNLPSRAFCPRPLPLCLSKSDYCQMNIFATSRPIQRRGISCLPTPNNFWIPASTACDWTQLKDHWEGGTGTIHTSAACQSIGIGPVPPTWFAGRCGPTCRHVPMHGLRYTTCLPACLQDSSYPDAAEGETRSPDTLTLCNHDLYHGLVSTYFCSYSVHLKCKQ